MLIKACPNTYHILSGTKNEDNTSLIAKYISLKLYIETIYQKFIAVIKEILKY